MKILLLSPWFPSPAFGGGLIRVLETLRHLSRRHEVTLLAPVGETPGADHLRTITDLGVAVVTIPVTEDGTAIAHRLVRGLLRGRPLIQGLHYHPALAREVRRLTTDSAYDIVHIEYSFMATYGAWVNPANPAKKVLSMHNIESLRFRREMHLAPWGPRRIALYGDHLLFGSWEQRAMRRFDGVAAVSSREMAWAREHAPKAEVAMVPNGVNVEHFQPMEPVEGTRTIVFTGLMNYPPNVDAVEWFCSAVLPLVARRYPDVRFSIVGDKPTATVRALTQRAGVEVTGRVPDVRQHVANAAALVVPIRSGAGTRLKILEAMAMRRPVVSTSQGAEGLQVASNINILLGDTSEAFAEHVCSVFANPELGDRIGREGRRLVEGAYDWRLCFRHLDELYERLTSHQ